MGFSSILTEYGFLLVENFLGLGPLGATDFRLQGTAVEDNTLIELKQNQEQGNRKDLF
jgi:hypothetical protein